MQAAGNQMNHPIRRLNRLHIALGLRMSFIHNKSRARSAGIVFLRRLRSRNKTLNRPRSAFIKADGSIKSIAVQNFSMGVC